MKTVQFSIFVLHQVDYHSYYLSAVAQGRQQWVWCLCISGVFTQGCSLIADSGVGSLNACVDGQLFCN